MSKATMLKTQKRQFNKHASIRNRVTINGKVRTETARRDDDLSIAASTTPRDNSSRLYIDTSDLSLCLNGRQMRTLARVLREHYDELGKDMPSRWGY